MNSSDSWRRRIWKWFAERFMRSKQIEEVLARTQERYLDAIGWAAIRGISEIEARKELLQGVTLGYLEQCFLYEWPDAPTSFVLPTDYVGKTIRLSEVGYIGDDDWREIDISPNRIRAVFIAATTR